MHQHEHEHEHAAEPAIVVKGDIRGTRSFVLGGLSSGHSIFHWYIQSFLVALPRIQESLSLSNFQVGALIAVREFVSGLINLPGGFLADIFRKYWGLIMAGCLALLGLGYMAIGVVPNYPVFLALMAVIAIPAALWHLPAMATLSRRFATQRGMALGAHNVGGSVGDLAGPLLTGLLLGATFWPGAPWRGVLFTYGIPALFLALVAWWAFKPLGVEHRGPRPSFKGQMRTTRRLARNPALLGLMLVGGIRGMGQIGFLTFLSIFLASEEVGMTDFWVGFHIALITVLGIPTAPILGVLSDRYGRKAILIPGFTIEGMLMLFLIGAGSGFMLSVVIALLGLFIFSTQPLIMAGAMDVIGEGGEATSLGFLFTSRFILAAISPLIAGRLFDTLGINSVFFYVSSLFLLAALVLLFIPLRRPVSSAAHARHHH